MENVPKGFISFDDAIKLIRKHTAKKPVVDLVFLASNRDYIEHGHNFTIHLVGLDENKKIVDRGTTWVTVRDDRDKFNLRGEIKEAVKRTMNMDIDFDRSALHNKSTVVDPQTNASGRPVANDPMASVLGYNHGYDTIL